MKKEKKNVMRKLGERKLVVAHLLYLSVIHLIIEIDTFLIPKLSRISQSQLMIILWPQPYWI